MLLLNRCLEAGKITFLGDSVTRWSRDNHGSLAISVKNIIRLGVEHDEESHLGNQSDLRLHRVCGL